MRYQGRPTGGTTLIDKGACEALTITFHDKLRPNACKFPYPIFKSDSNYRKRGEVYSRSPFDFKDPTQPFT